MKIVNKPTQLFWILIGTISLLRLLASAGFGLSVDEAHYVLYGKILDWSYFDHPPLVGWAQAIFQILPIDPIIRSRLPAVILGALSSYLIFNYLKTKDFSEKNALWAVAVLNVTPIFNALSVALLPDTLLIPLTVLIIQQTDKTLLQSNQKNWLLLGTLLGLAALTKYTAILYVFALAVIFLLKGKVREILNLNLWLGVLLALFMISPILYWNIQNNFASFQYQASHVLSLDSNILKTFASSFFIQIVSWGIGPCLLAVYGHYYFFKKEKTLFINELIFITIFLVFFAYASIAEVLLPHWMMIYFIILIPLSYAYFLNKIKKTFLIVLSILPSALLSFLILFELAFKILPTNLTATLYKGIYGWEEIVKKANAHLDHIKSEKKALAVLNWTLGSRAKYYNTEASELFVIDKRKDQFDIWNKNQPEGYDFLILVEAKKKDEQLVHINCSQLNIIDELVTKIKDVPINHFLYYHCVNFLDYR